MELNPTGMPNLTLLIALGYIRMKMLEQTLSSLGVYFGSVSPGSFVCEKLVGSECYGGIVGHVFKNGLVRLGRMAIVIDVTNETAHPIPNFGSKGLPTGSS